MTPSLEGSPTKTKEAPSPHEVRLAPLYTNPVLQYLREFEQINSFSHEIIIKSVVFLSYNFPKSNIPS